MIEKSEGVDQESSTARTEANASDLIPLFIREIWVDGERAEDWVESQSIREMRRVVREAVKDEYREGTAPGCEFTVDEAMDALEYVINLHEPRFENATRVA